MHLERPMMEFSVLLSVCSGGMTSLLCGRSMWLPESLCRVSFVHFRLEHLEPSAMSGEREHLSIVICGHVDSGKSTTTGRLLFDLGGLPERELEKLKQEAERLGKASFAFAFFMDRQKEERERGVTISCTTKEFFTPKWHYTIVRSGVSLTWLWV